MKEYKKSFTFILISLAFIVAAVVGFFFRSKQTVGGIIAWVVYFVGIFGALFFFFITLNEYRRAKEESINKEQKRKKGKR